MLRIGAAIVVLAAAPRGARAQALTAAQPRTHVEAVAQSAFGNVTSQSYGGEVGYNVWRDLAIFAEFGQTRDVSPSEVGASAQQIAGYLSQTQPTAAYTVKMPAAFVAFGVKYFFPVANLGVLPYVAGAGGFARVTKDVAFQIGGSDVTTQLSQYGVVLGTDLSGDYTSPVTTFGGGVIWPIWQNMIVDFQFRFSHIGAEDPSTPSINVGRAGVGVGVRF
jgi:opacity protein-like surface antigen